MKVEVELKQDFGDDYDVRRKIVATTTVTLEGMEKPMSDAMLQEIVKQTRDAVTDELVKITMREHGTDLLTALKLEDIKQLALIKSAEMTKGLWGKATL